LILEWVLVSCQIGASPWPLSMLRGHADRWRRAAFLPLATLLGLDGDACSMLVQDMGTPQETPSADLYWTAICAAAALL
jgi:hypothetical protein